MKITLTLDDDVAALLKQVRRTRKINYKDLINEALRQGLKTASRLSQKTEPYKTRSVSLGRCLVSSLDGISEVLTIAEGKDFK
jgi:hypothetical protein